MAGLPTRMDAYLDLFLDDHNGATDTPASATTTPATTAPAVTSHPAVVQRPLLYLDPTSIWAAPGAQPACRQPLRPLGPGGGQANQSGNVHNLPQPQVLSAGARTAERAEFASLQRHFMRQQYAVARLDMLLDAVRRFPHADLPPLVPSDAELDSTDDPASWMNLILAGDLHHACLMQAQLLCAPTERQDELSKTIAAHLVQASIHPYGSWLVRAMLKRDPKLVTRLQGECVRLALTSPGAQVLICAMECGGVSLVRDELLSGQIRQTVSSRHGATVWALLLHPSGNRASWLGMIRRIPLSLAGDWATLAQTEWGSVVVQLYLEVSAQESVSKAVVEELLAACPLLLLHPQAVAVMTQLLYLEQARPRLLSLLIKHAALISLSPYSHRIIAEAFEGNDSVFISNYAKALCEVPLIAPETDPPDLPDGLIGTFSRRPALVQLALSDQGSEMIALLLYKSEASAWEALVRTVMVNAVFLKGDPNGSRVEKMCQRARAYSGI